jgi:hypothetical protein
MRRELDDEKGGLCDWNTGIFKNSNPTKTKPKIIPSRI